MNAFAQQLFFQVGEIGCPGQVFKNIETIHDSALITRPEARDPALAARLDAVAGRVLGE